MNKDKELMRKAFESALSKALGGNVRFVDCTSKKKSSKTKLSLTELIKSKEGYNSSFDNIMSMIDECNKDKERVKFTTEIRCFEDEIQIDTDKICICLNHDTITYHLGKSPRVEDIKAYKPTQKNIQLIFDKFYSLFYV